MLGLRRITLEVFEFNPRARRVYEKVGYAVTGVRPGALVFDGVAVAAVDMAVDAESWAAQSGPIAVGSACEGSIDPASGSSAPSAGIGSGTPAVIRLPSARVPPVCGRLPSLPGQPRAVPVERPRRPPRRGRRRSSSPRTSTGTGSSPSSTLEAQLGCRERDPHPGAAPGEPEGQRLPAVGQPRVEAQPAAVVAHAAEAVDQRGPHAAGRGHVHAVDGVAVQVGQVDEQRLAGSSRRRQLVVADLGGDDRLHDRRQRRVAGGDRVVVLEVGALLLGGELVAAAGTARARRRPA